MGIYDKSIELDNYKKYLLAVGIIALALLVVFLFYQIVNKPENPVEIKFERNQINAGESTRVFVKVTNNTGKDLENIPLRIYAKEKTEFDIFPLNPQFQGNINYLSDGTSREIAFVINPVKQILPGSYVIVAEAIISDSKFTKEAIVSVK